MQSCWLPPSQRPTINEVFLLLSSLLAEEQGRRKSARIDEDEQDYEEDNGHRRRGESEESFERRWDALRPPAFQSAANKLLREREYGREDVCLRGNGHSFPLLDPVDNMITPTSELDDILTVTETSKGLNFEYFWEKAHGRRGYKPLPPPQPIPTPNSAHRQMLDTPTVVPVISARSPSLASEYYIRLEEHTPQDKSPSLHANRRSLKTNPKCLGDLELVELQTGTRSTFGHQDGFVRATSQTVRSSEVQILVPNTGLVEFSRESCNRVTDYAVIDISESPGEVKAKQRCSGSVGSQAPVLPPKPRSMSASSGSHLHSRPLPAPPIGYTRSYGLDVYPGTSYPMGKVETSDSLLMSSCSLSKPNFDHLGFNRTHQTLPPSPSLSPSIPPSSGGHPLFPPPQNCPPPLPPHYRPPNYSSETYSRYNAMHLQRDPLSCDNTNVRNADRGITRSQSLYNSRDGPESYTKDDDYSKMTRSQSTIPKIERTSSSSPEYLQDDEYDEDDSPFMSPGRPTGGTTIQHTSLVNERDPATAELFSRGMKRTQSRLATILPAIWREDAVMQRERVAAARKSPIHLFLTEISNESVDLKVGETSWAKEGIERKDSGFKGMRRSQSLVTELDSSSQAWGPDKDFLTGYEARAKKRELFLTEIETSVSDCEDAYDGDGGTPVSRFGTTPHPFAHPGDLPTYAEAEEAFSNGMKKSHSKISVESVETEPKKGEMTREEFLKEIQSAETFLTEIITRQRKTDESVSPIPLSPEYESICIDPESSQTIQFEKVQTGKSQSETKEAIYAQVTKRAKRSEIKVAVRPEIPVLQIASELQNLESGQSVHPVSHISPDSISKNSVNDFMPTEKVAIKLDLLLDHISPVIKEEQNTDTKCNSDDWLVSGVPLCDLQSMKIEEINRRFHDQCLSHDCVSEGPIETRSLCNHNGSQQGKDNTHQITGSGQIQSATETDLNSILVHGKERTQRKDSSVLPSLEVMTSNSTFEEVDTNSKGPFAFLNQSPNKLTSLNLTENRNSVCDTTSTEMEYISDISYSAIQNSMSQDFFHVNKQITQMETACKATLEQTTPNDSETCSRTMFHDPDIIKEKILQSDSSLSLNETSTDIFHSPMVHEPNSDQSLSTMTPSDSILSPLTSGSLDCLTPGDSCSGGASSGWRVLGTETPHRDSAYFSDSDLESGEGSGRRGTDGFGPSRLGGTRAGERGILMGIEEKMEDEGPLEHGRFKEVKIKQNIQELWGSNEAVIGRADIGTDDVRVLESVMAEKGLIHSADKTVSPGDSLSEGNAEFIARLFSKEDDETKTFPFAESPHHSFVKNEVMSHTFSDAVDAGLLSHTVSEPQRDTSSCQKELTKPPQLPISEIDNEQPSDEGKSRLSRFYCLQSDYSKCNETEINTKPSNVDTNFSATHFIWSETNAKPTGEKRNEPDIQDTDANELGLRNLSYLECEDEQTNERSESQLAVGELCFNIKETSQNAAEEQVSCMEPSKDSSDESGKGASMGLELKEKELWSALEEDFGVEETVKGEFNCHKFQQGGLHLWPVENDQWAAAETRKPEVGLGSELYPSFGKTAWEEDENLEVSHEFWESEANDELADSESHPCAQGIFEDTFNDERIGQTDYQPSEKQTRVISSGVNETSEQIPEERLDFQQEENMENLDMENGKPQHCSRHIEMEVENLENPEMDALVEHRPVEIANHQTRNSETCSQNDVGDEFLGEEELNRQQDRLSTENTVGVSGCLTNSPSSSVTKHAQTNELEHLQQQREHSNNVPRDQIQATWVPKTEASKDLVMYSEEHQSCTVDVPNSSDCSHFISVDPEDLNTENSRYDDESNHCPPINKKAQDDVFFEKERPDSPSFPSLTTSTNPDSCQLHSSNAQCSAPELISMELTECAVSPHTEVEKCQSSSSFPNTVHHIEIKTGSNLFCATDETPEHKEQSESCDDTNGLDQCLEELDSGTITHNKGITANLGKKTHTSLMEENHIHLESGSVQVNDRNSLSQKVSHPPLSQCSLNSIPELLISEWKDLDEEPLEDFEKLEQLCCISGDEETLGDLFLGNLDLLESLKRTPEQRTSDASGTKIQDDSASASEGQTKKELKEEVDGIPRRTVLENSAEQYENISPNVQGEAHVSLDKTTGQHVAAATDGSKGQRTLSKMQTKNGLMMQVSCKMYFLNGMKVYSLLYVLKLTTFCAFMFLFRFVRRGFSILSVKMLKPMFCGGLQ